MPRVGFHGKTHECVAISTGRDGAHTGRVYPYIQRVYAHTGRMYPRGKRFNVHMESIHMHTARHRQTEGVAMAMDSVHKHSLCRPDLGVRCRVHE